MVVPIKTTNKLESTDLKLNTNNKALQARKEELRHSVAGAKAQAVNNLRPL